MRRGVPVVLLATLVAGCGLLLGTSDDPYVDPTLSIPPGPEGGEAAPTNDSGSDAGNDVEIEAEAGDAGDDAPVDPDI
jgi:hypothetical protein